MLRELRARIRFRLGNDLNDLLLCVFLRHILIQRESSKPQYAVIWNMNGLGVKWRKQEGSTISNYGEKH